MIGHSRFALSMQQIRGTLNEANNAFKQDDFQATKNYLDRVVRFASDLGKHMLDEGQRQTITTNGRKPNCSHEALLTGMILGSIQKWKAEQGGDPFNQAIVNVFPIMLGEDYSNQIEVMMPEGGEEEASEKRLIITVEEA